MKIVKADPQDAPIVGAVHSCAWKQAYKDIFPQEYLDADTQENRTKEFWESCNSDNINYYLIYTDEVPVGIVKVELDGSYCEISSIYILEEHRNKGYGKEIIAYIKDINTGKNVYLWVLEENVKARDFYEKNGFKNTGIKRNIWRGKDYVQIRYELLPEVWAYEMYYDKRDSVESTICCVPFVEEYFEEYKSVYNGCFYEMRKTLDIEPYNWYSEYNQMADKTENIFLFLIDNQIIGSVACYGNEIDDLIIKKSYQNKGYGKQLLLWAINHIRQHNDFEIILHVAEWNKSALKLYENVGFVVRKKEKVR